MCTFMGNGKRHRTVSKALLASFLLIAARLQLDAQQNAEQSAPATSSPTIKIISPIDYQVLQRESKLRGHIPIRGQGPLSATRVDARLTGSSVEGLVSHRWHRLSLDRRTGVFQADMEAPAGGFYFLEVRVARRGAPREEIDVPHVGIGEVFVVAGQSNSTNYGETLQRTATQMVTTFDGLSWRIADDPQPGVQDDSKKGSFLPLFGDALYRKYHVPIGVASVGRGSSSVRQWLPAGRPVEVMPTMQKYVTTAADGALVSDGTLFNGLMARIRGFGPHGFRAVLWHQGESDAHQPPGHDISAETYQRMLTEVIQETRREAGWDIPWFVAQVSYHSPEDPSCPPLRAAQESLWTAGVALQGPDSDTLTETYRQNNGKGVHMNDAGLKAHGLLWAEAVERYLDSILH
jgi:hypothetical protein